jgi:tol-pal system protein YbgF
MMNDQKTKRRWAAVAACLQALLWAQASATAGQPNEQEMRALLSRQQSQLAQLQTRVGDIDEWRSAAQKQSETTLTRAQELHELQQELGRFVTVIHDRQIELIGDHAETKSQQKMLYAQLNDLLAQVQKEQAQTGARVTKVEEQSPNKVLLEFSNRLDLLNADLNKLRGLVEKLTYDLQNAEKRQNSMYGDLDARMRRLEGQGNLAAEQKKDRDVLADIEARLNRLEQGAAAGTVIPGTTPAPVAMPQAAAAAAAAKPATSLPGANLSVTDAPAIQRAYDTAYSSYKSGDFNVALQSFQSFVKRYPKHPLTGNAQYWIGDTQLQLHDYKAAVEAQRELMEKFPDSEKVPDALFVIGRAEFASGNPEAAKKTWEEVVSKYPTSPSAEKARKELLRLK